MKRDEFIDQVKNRRSEGHERIWLHTVSGDSVTLKNKDIEIERIKENGEGPVSVVTSMEEEERVYTFSPAHVVQVASVVQDESGPVY